MSYVRLLPQEIKRKGGANSLRLPSFIIGRIKVNNDNIILTASNIRYLVAMKNIDDPIKGIRSIDIAKTLGYKKSSVHNMLDSFLDMGLIEKSPNGTIRFTTAGNAISIHYQTAYGAVERIIKESFPDIRGMEEVIFLILSRLPEKNL